jgi:hypothetical protein
MWMRIEDLKAKIWWHFAEAGKRRERDEPTQSHPPEVELGLIRASRRQWSRYWQWCSPRSSPSLELIDSRISKLRVHYGQAFLPSATQSVAMTVSSSEGHIAATAGSATASSGRVWSLVGTVVRT